jgi:hypothetical protein
MRRVALLLSVAVALAAVAALHPSAAAPQSGRVIDRTLLCTTIGQAGVRKLTVSALAPVRGQTDPASGEPQLAGARLHTGPPTSSSGGGRRAVGGTSLVDADAGAPVPENNWSFSLSRQQCRASRVHVPLSARGLMGGAADALGDSYECFPPRRVLVRVRAVFRSRTSLRLNSVTGHLFTRMPVREVFLAVRTSSGKPLAYAAASESGKARVFAAPSCLPE